MTGYFPHPPKKSEAVILLHGIWMKGFCLYPLANRLRAQGYRTVCFSYRSLRDSLNETLVHLHRCIENLEAEAIHFVGHSLGGLLIQQLLERYPEQRPGGVVALGTPFAGSIVARQLYSHQPGRYLLGQIIEEGLLIESAPPWEFTQKLGIIAGVRGLGIGQLIARLPQPNDGTVGVIETKLSGMTDHCLVRTNHTGLLFSPAVAQLTGTFLRYHHFTP
ncbi:esterase/lipase family protein [Nitrosococcus wardiae]|uniref:Alpha/beta fold hydrolase n=1 Tax=Nitrosococcus wardiae TaxID=1814290 RepID=A0A4P7C2E1_9GAMM|nr:alpha/beta fold hydrolase [Nitrosococcus wardiae]QBQ55847.1 alpha/beta fold hydrolase [Nitrosococcus wardiae]